MAELRPSLLVARQRPGALALLVAATCLLLLLAAAVALALNGAGRSLDGLAGPRLLIQVAEGDATRRDAVTDAVETRMARRVGADHVHVVPEATAQALIAPYVAGMNIADLPIPTLIEIDGGGAPQVAAILRDLPAVSVTAAGAELAPLQRLVAALRSVAAIVALVAITATALVAVLAARAGLAREAATLDILHALGATDGQIARLLAGRIVRDAAIGAAAGGGVGLLLLAGLAARLTALGPAAAGLLGPAAWITLILLPVLLVMVTILAAQVTLATMLRRAP